VRIPRNHDCLGPHSGHFDNSVRRVRHNIRRPLSIKAKIILQEPLPHDLDRSRRRAGRLFDGHPAKAHPRGARKPHVRLGPRLPLHLDAIHPQRKRRPRRRRHELVAQRLLVPARPHIHHPDRPDGRVRQQDRAGVPGRQPVQQAHLGDADDLGDCGGTAGQVNSPDAPASRDRPGGKVVLAGADGVPVWLELGDAGQAFGGGDGEQEGALASGRVDEPELRLVEAGGEEGTVGADGDIFEPGARLGELEYDGRGVGWGSHGRGVVR